MAKNDVEKVTDEKLARGGILVKLYFDMQNEDKEKLQPLMVDLINERLMKEKGVVYCFGAIEEPIEKQGIFITSAIVTMLFDSFAPLINVAFNYAPAGIEILKPQKDMKFTVTEIQAILNQLSGISVNYSKFILEKVMDKDELAKIKAQLENRVELGKKFIDEKKDEKN